MKLSVKYQRPTIVARLNPEGYVRGSARAPGDSELKDFKAFLNESGFFEYASGHPLAFGISIANNNLSDFHKYANDKLENTNFEEGVYNVNFERYAVDKDLENLITELAEYPDVWGQNCNTPLIFVQDINITPKDIQIMGKSSDTVKIVKNGISYIKFKAKDMIEELQKYDDIKLNIVGKANLNEWGGRVTPQIFIEDYEIKNGFCEF